MSNKSIDKQAFWRSILADFSESGQTATAYCKEHSIKIAIFSYWKKKLMHGEPAMPEFIQVSTEKQFLLPFHGSSPVTIHLGSIEICISDNCHPDLLDNLIGVLHKYA